jgi:hypothetical protein
MENDTFETTQEIFGLAKDSSTSATVVETKTTLGKSESTKFEKQKSTVRASTPISKPPKKETKKKKNRKRKKKK